MWRRYRGALAWAVPTGAALGAVLGILFYMGSNAGYREQGGWGAFGYLVGGSALLGVVVALFAAIGGAVAVVIRDRPMLRSGRSRVRAIVFGAVIGAAVPWLAVAVATGVTGTFGVLGPAILVLPLVVSAVLAGIVADALARRAERAAEPSRD